MKTIHKRLYTVIPRPPTVAAAATTSAPRVRSNSVSSSCSSVSSASSSSSVSSSRGLHTSAAFPFFDSPPSPHTTGARPPSNIAPRQAKAEVEVETHAPYSQHQSNNSSTHSGNSSGNNHPPTQSQTQQSNLPPYPLAFTTAQSDASSSFYTSTVTSHHNFLFHHPSFGPLSSFDTSPNDLLETTYSPAKQGTRYHLDVGAYGIPKHSRGGDMRIAGCDGKGGFPFCASNGNGAVGKERYASVLVGEDAYFVRDNAMGVADGVGGWSKLHKTGKPDESSSALFAQRLMHYCSEEVNAASSSTQTEPPLQEELEEELEDSLEDLTDGLDVLMILEKAYEKTMKAHVVSTPDSTPSASDGQNANLTPASSLPSDSPPSPVTSAPADEPSPSPSPASPPTASPAPQSEPTPLREGSATALLAVLDHAPAPAPSSTSPNNTSPPTSYPPSSSSFFFPRPRVFPFNLSSPDAVGRDKGMGRDAQAPGQVRAVIRIAHLGDCMGMLVRGEEIVWRTEEMWWNFNTPLQLGPASKTTPRDAQVFTIPVQEDDILVLASDGLSDNLWDEEILDEVVRFRRSFMSPPHHHHHIPSAPRSTTLGRRTLAGMLSEALCSRARSVSERQGKRRRHRRPAPNPNPKPATATAASSPLFGSGVKLSAATAGAGEAVLEDESEEDEVPFARRAREEGRSFSGGKMDDISVLIAVVSPAEPSTNAHAS